MYASIWSSKVHDVYAIGISGVLDNLMTIAASSRPTMTPAACMSFACCCSQLTGIEPNAAYLQHWGRRSMGGGGAVQTGVWAASTLRSI